MEGMTLERAQELLDISDPSATEKNAEYARGRLAHMVGKTPLRYKVACQIVIEAAEPGAEAEQCIVQDEEAPGFG